MLKALKILTEEIKTYLSRITHPLGHGYQKSVTHLQKILILL